MASAKRWGGMGVALEDIREVLQPECKSFLFNAKIQHEESGKFARIGRYYSLCTKLANSLARFFNTLCHPKSDIL